MLRTASAFAVAVALRDYPARRPVEAVSAVPVYQDRRAGYVVPRTPDGKPDLQGVWANNSVTPMTRPTQWKDKERLTDAELTELQAIVAEVHRPGRRRDLPERHPAGARRQGQGEVRSDLLRPDDRQLQPVLDGRAGLGQPDVAHHRSAERPVPAVYARAMKRAAAWRSSRRRPRAVRRGPSDGPEDRPLIGALHHLRRAAVRPLQRYMQIIQSPETVVILQEMIHDARIVPMDRQPHLPKNVRQLHGDSRGRWEGDTLVVETTNFSVGNLFLGTAPDLKLTERYTRVSTTSSTGRSRSTTRRPGPSRGRS